MKRTLREGKPIEILVFTCEACDQKWETDEWRWDRGTSENSGGRRSICTNCNREAIFDGDKVFSFIA